MQRLTRHAARLAALAFPLVVAGFVAAPVHGKEPPAAKSPAKPDAKAEEEAEVKANLAKLSPEDRKLAEDQRFCAVEGEESRLGAMGVPIKLSLQGKTVFICCKGCRKQAMAYQEQTVARAEAFRKKYGTKK